MYVYIYIYICIYKHILIYITQGPTPGVAPGRAVVNARLLNSGGRLCTMIMIIMMMMNIIRINSMMITFPLA